MRPLFPSAVALSLFGIASLASATSLPVYPSPGTVAPTYTYTATASGSVDATFLQGGALSGGHELYTDFVELYDVTSNTSSGFVFNSQTSHTGDSLSLGQVYMGDLLVFKIFSQNTGQTFASDPALSQDGYNHAYSASFNGGTFNGVAMPAGLYVGLEDTDIATNDNPGNIDYQDVSLLVEDVSGTATTSPVPEPSSFVLLGSGALSAVGLLRRRLAR